MFRHPKITTTIALVALASGAAWAAAGSLTAYFMSAPAGVDVPFVSVPLPPVVWQPGQSIPPSIAFRNGFNPGVNDLVSGGNVITNERQMRFVWNRLFAVPYDTTLFDFQNSFVILVGGGEQDLGSFGISAVERVDAEYAGGFASPGTEVDPFLAVTSTQFFPGQPPPFPPPPYFAVSAVRVPLTEFDDVVFHRTVVAAP